MCASDDRYVWLNQYSNPRNWKAHYRNTAPAIARQFPELVLFVGAGTCGTLMGCAHDFREWNRPVRIVAVDSVGSVTFGGPPGRRMIPGLGTGVTPAILDASYVDEVVRVDEADTIRACHRLAARGFLFGGSTGTVISGAMECYGLRCPGRADIGSAVTRIYVFPAELSIKIDIECGSEYPLDLSRSQKQRTTVMPGTTTITLECDHGEGVNARSPQMPFQYDLILDDSLQNRDSRSRGSRARAVSNCVQWAQFEWAIDHRWLTS